MDQIGSIARILALGVLPWLNYLKPLRWHLRASNFNPVPIFNAIATLCAALVSVYFYYGSPDPEEVFLPLFKLLLPLFIVCALAYFGLFLAYKVSVSTGRRRWPLGVAFAVYILMFLCFAFINVNLEIRKEYRIVQGHIFDGRTKAGVSGAEIALYLLDDAVKACTSDSDGSYFIAVPKKVEVDRIKVEKEGFEPYMEILKMRTVYPILLRAK